MTTGAFSRNVGKLFSKFKLVTDNLLFIQIILFLFAWYQQHWLYNLMSVAFFHVFRNLCWTKCNWRPQQMVCWRATSFDIVLLRTISSVMTFSQALLVITFFCFGRFSAMLDEGNTVTRVFYPSKENVAVVAFKKKIAELFFGNANDMWVGPWPPSPLLFVFTQ